MRKAVSMLHYSLILTSCGRLPDLDRFVTSLIGQSYQGAVELIFVNQGTCQIEGRFLYPENINPVTINVGHVIPLSAARNIGLRHATGDIIAFPDDDCWYKATLLEDLATFFSAHAEFDCICTQVFDPLQQKAYGGRPFGVQKTITFANLFKLPISVGIFVRKNSLDIVGGRFDESLGAGTVAGSGEETEILARLLLADQAVEYVGHLQVYHPVPEYSEDDCSKYYSYGLGFGYLNGKLLKTGQAVLLIYFSEIIIRSLMGAVVHFNNHLKRMLYWKRFLGVVKGFTSALFGGTVDQS